ncbi:hypothetical protein F443_12220 [Phytophthora nicotianae P1569]|uniref:Uncharacterized protein n=1 Tax=Phytophthora nicotianae P1569 TaxID=1317065 RepID=V9EVY4_PHYNI|nr:hypothetical protein F443_12220 [Phytophthora nicotianae P1569]
MQGELTHQRLVMLDYGEDACNSNDSTEDTSFDLVSERSDGDVAMSALQSEINRDINQSERVEAIMSSEDVAMTSLGRDEDELSDEVPVIASISSSDYAALVTRALQCASEAAARFKNASELYDPIKTQPLIQEKSDTDIAAMKTPPTSSSIAGKPTGLCQYPERFKQAQVRGLCCRHGGYRKCKIDNCSLRAIAQSLCRSHAVKCQVDGSLLLQAVKDSVADMLENKALKPRGATISKWSMVIVTIIKQKTNAASANADSSKNELTTFSTELADLRSQLSSNTSTA